MDGRHRARVCEELRIECDAFEWEDDIDPVQTVLSLNLKRRHLDTSQRAMIAAKMANMKRGRPEKTNGQNCPLKTDDAATALNVSPKSVKNAKQVLDSGDKDLIEQVEQGKTTVSAAANKLRGKTNKRPKTQNDEPKPTEAEEVYEDVPDDDEPTAMEMIEFVRSFKAFWSRCSMDQREMLVELVSELNAEPFVQSARIYKS